MPLIPTSFDKEIALLESSGVSTRNSGKIEDRFFNEMQNGGASPEEVVGTIAGILAGGENSSVKLHAAKILLSMYMHPAFVPRKEAEREQAQTINIHIGGGNLNLQNIITPQRTTRDE